LDSNNIETSNKQKTDDKSEEEQ